MLLQEFWDDRYVGYCERLREVTRVGYESAWRCHVEPVFGSMELADIGVDDIELWLSGFASPGAARKAWAVLRQMCRPAPCRAPRSGAGTGCCSVVCPLPDWTY